MIDCSKIFSCYFGFHSIFANSPVEKQKERYGSTKQYPDWKRPHKQSGKTEERVLICKNHHSTKLIL